MTSIRRATSAVAATIPRILKVDAIEELITVRIVDAVRPSVISKNTEPIAEPLLQTDEGAVVIRVATTIGLHDARIVFALIRIRQIQLSALIEIACCRASTRSARHRAVAGNVDGRICLILEPEMCRLVAEITQTQSPITSELFLEAYVPLLHVCVVQV